MFPQKLLWGTSRFHELLSLQKEWWLVFLFPTLLHLFFFFSFLCPDSLRSWIIALFFPRCLASCLCSFEDNQPGVFLLLKAIVKLRRQLGMAFLGCLVRFNLQKLNKFIYVRSKAIELKVLIKNPNEFSSTLSSLFIFPNIFHKGLISAFK